jgi:activator of HSP90 ATPase
MAKTIKQKVVIKGKTPHEVYEMLMDSKKHAAFTGEPAKISKQVGGKFTAYGDFIEGTNVELIQDKKIVQNWRGSDWAEGIYSKATFKLKAVKAGTELSFEQVGVPNEQYEGIKKGWYDFYWDKME